MQAKITLYTEKELIEQIKRYVKENDASVSKIVNTFFKNMLQKNQPKHTKSQITDSLTGRLNDSSADVKSYHDYLEEKYL